MANLKSSTSSSHYISEIIKHQLNPVIINAIDGINNNQHNSCFIHGSLKTQNQTLVLKIHQEVRRFEMSLYQDQWNIQRLKNIVLDKIEDLFSQGLLNTVFRAIDDLVILKIEIIPGHGLYITTLYARTEKFRFLNNQSWKSRDELQIQEEEREARQAQHLTKIKELLPQGLELWLNKQTEDFTVGYFPEFFIYRDRIGIQDKYINLEGNWLDQTQLASAISQKEPDEIIKQIFKFIDHNLTDNQNSSGDYEFKIDIDSQLNLRSIYHRIIIHPTTS